MPAEKITDPLRAAEMLRAGKLVAFPTETVYGLGVDPTSAPAVERLFAVKGRPTNNPLIVHVPTFAAATSAARDIPTVAYDLMTRFAPGPLTVVVPKRNEIVPQVTAGLDTVGIRVPDHALTLEMLRAAVIPIAAPSANRSGKPSATTWQAVLEDFGDAIDGVLIGQAARVGLESTVVDCTRPPICVLRPGGVSLEQLREVVSDVVMAGAQAAPGENSPGRLHPHYQPRALVQLISSAQEAVASPNAAYLGLDQPDHCAQFGMAEIFPSLDDYAHRFYEALREVDRRGLQLVYLQSVPRLGIGTALSDRISRAAERRT